MRVRRSFFFVHFSFFIFHLSFLLLSACAAQSPTYPATQPPLPTPTLLGTVNPAAPLNEVEALPSSTPRPAACIFRTDRETEYGVYRFEWENVGITLDTKLGPINVDGPRGLPPGPRQLILVHNAGLPASFGVAINFDVGGSLLYDPANGVGETRDVGGTVLIQSMADPTNDANGLPPYLDIIRVERTFGYYPNSTVRVYLAGVRDAPQIWTYQSVAVSLGGETYTRQSYSDGRIGLTVADSQGRVKDWPGPAAVEGNVVSFALQTGVAESLSASTFTSGGGGDTAGPYPVDAMQAVWDAAKEFCP